MKDGIEKEEDETPGYETPMASPSKKQKKKLENGPSMFSTNTPHKPLLLKRTAEKCVYL